MKSNMKILYQSKTLKQLNILLLLFMIITTELWGDFSYLDPKAPKGGSLKVAYVKTFTTFNPYGVVGFLPTDYFILTHDSLLVIPFDNLEKFYPLIAEKYQISKEGIIFYLNPIALWNNGKPIRAEDVKFTFEMIKEYGSLYYKDKLTAVEEIKVITPTKIVFVVKNPSEELFFVLASLPIISKEYWQDKSFIAPSLEVPVSSGAYTISNFKAGNFIEFKRNNNYWGRDIQSRKGLFNFDYIKQFYVRSPLVESRMFKNNEINFKAASISELIEQTDREFFIKQNSIPVFKAYFFNVDKINKDIRKIIVASYDFNKTKEYFLSHNQKRINGLFENSIYSDQSFKYSDTLQEVDCKVCLGLEISFLFKSLEEFKLSQLLINRLKELGFSVSYKIASYEEYSKLVDSKNYQIIISELRFAFPPGQEVLSYFFHKEKFNYSNYSNIKIKKILDSGFNVDNLQKVDLLLKKEYLFIPMFYDRSQKYIHKEYLDYKKSNYFDIYSWWDKNTKNSKIVSRETL